MGGEILVVDDDEPIREVLTHRLESAAYSVLTCEDGQAAADLLDAGCEPALMILDVMMPRLDGTRLLRMIRNGEVGSDPDLPVIMLSSRGREDDIVEGVASGVDEYITKPFRADELLAYVKRYVGDPDRAESD